MSSDTDVKESKAECIGSCTRMGPGCVAGKEAFKIGPSAEQPIIVHI